MKITEIKTTMLHDPDALKNNVVSQDFIRQERRDALALFLHQREGWGMC